MRTRAGSVLVGAGTALAVVGTVHELVNLRRLRRTRPPGDPVTETVSVLVPARDEARQIGSVVRCVLDQTGVADLDVVVLDDGSCDGTADVARRTGGGDPRLRVVRGPDGPPPGWLGKPHACARLADLARGSVLVYVDADVTLAPTAVAAAVATLRADGLDVLSPWPRQLAEGAAARLVQPLLIWSWATTLPLRRAERSRRPSLAIANGQFLVVDAGALARAGGWSAVRGEVLDDMALARAVRRAGGATGVADGFASAGCRMYDGWSALHAGYRKSLWSAFGGPAGSVAVGAGMALAYLVPPLAALGGSRVGLAGYAAAVAGRAAVARRTGGRAWPDAAAHPVSVALFLGLLASSWRGRRAGTLTWKGRRLWAPV